jgi:hypothetical protein
MPGYEEEEALLGEFLGKGERALDGEWKRNLWRSPFGEGRNVENAGGL